MASSIDAVPEATKAQCADSKIIYYGLGVF